MANPTTDWLTANNLGTYSETAAAQMSGAGVEGGRLVQEITARESLFRDMYRQLVGTDPGEAEFKTFFDNIAPNAALATHDVGTQQQLRDLTAQHVNTRYQSTAEKRALAELQGTQAEASRLSEVFRTQGRQAISDTEGRLMDFQTRLFEKLRPQLMTSLQAQGLLNTGGLNEAFAGQAKDLASEVSNQLSGAYLENEQAANQIAFGGAAAPYEMQRQLAMSRLPYLQQQTENAIGRNQQINMSNLAYQQQLNLMQKQADLQAGSKPSFLKGLAGQAAGNLVNAHTKFAFDTTNTNPQASYTPSSSSGSAPTANYAGSATNSGAANPSGAASYLGTLAFA
jgi:hypothetical protein